MAGVAVTWQADPSASVASYNVFFAVTPADGSAPTNYTLTVPRDAASDQNGYATDYLRLSPAPPALNNGDSVAVTAVSIDTLGQSSPTITAGGSPVVIAIAPPPAPTGPVNLVAVQS